MRLSPTLLPALALALSGCAGLQLTLVDAAHGPPSNVAVFFAVDTRAGDPVPGLEATDFAIYEDGARVSVDESKQTIVNPEVAAEHYTLLLVDMSGSVTESDQVPLIQAAAESFASSLEGYQKVAIYAFDGSEEIFPIQPFRSTASGIRRLSSFRPRDPSTNLHGAVVAAADVLDEALESASTPLRFGTLVVFTDGTDRAARVSEGEMLDRLDDTGFEVFAIGVGNEIDEAALGRLAYSGYVLIEDAAALQAAFQTISERIVGYTRRFYLLSYCSPARAGIHEVTVEAHAPDGATGSLSYRFDATGFGPGCNPERPPPFSTTRINIPRRRGAGGRLRVTLEASAEASAP